MLVSSVFQLVSVPLSASVLAAGGAAIYLKRYRDQKETTARTWILRNWTEGRPKT
jgi:hypothetical protein